jgi:hypothetical protein
MDTVVSGEGIASGPKQLRQRKKKGDKEPIVVTAEAPEGLSLDRNPSVER